ncbi:MAG: DUF1127 domain-containing protein [Rhodospirillales bacterium]|nr:DUF1127 domain-containing protein [Rhodospirillales bacterium]
MFELQWTTGNSVAAADTRRQLNALSDHQLNDIGLRRDQIEEVARDLTTGVQRTKVRVQGHFSGRGLSLAPLLRAYRTA